jgi:hypothetical protein
MTFTDYIATSEATYRIERRIAEAENHRLLRRLRRARKAANNAKNNRVPRQRTPLDKERPEQQQESTKAVYREAA